jgi:hypothetical protein
MRNSCTYTAYKPLQAIIALLANLNLTVVYSYLLAQSPDYHQDALDTKCNNVAFSLPAQYNMVHGSRFNTDLTSSWLQDNQAPEAGA